MYLITIRTVALTVLLSLCSLSAREVIDLDQGWRFALGDHKGAAKTAHSDADWRVLNVPHDWAFEADYAEDAAQGAQGGYKPGGIAWYRKSFQLPKDWNGKQGNANKRVTIAFDSVYMNSEVWINGVHLGKRPYGYSSFEYELTKHLKPGRNQLSVRVDNKLEPSARWYHGCGITGHVKLKITDAVYIPSDGVFITTPVISDTRAEVQVVTELATTMQDASEVTLDTVILDPAGKTVAQASTKTKFSGDSQLKQTLSVPNPALWDVDTPNLYKVISRVTGAEQSDELTTRFGIRSLQWKKDTGFWLNGRVVKLKGVADHSEAGPVGAAYPDELLRWKLEQIKAMGCNSIRTAHNPQTPIFYDLCDELGILVMNEIFDGWSKKAPQDYGKHAFNNWWERDLRAWLKRDRNHPSVIVWSVGNETGGMMGKKLVKVCHEMDPTRKVSSGHASPGAMDIEGVNGHSEFQHFFHHPPKKPFVSTEAPHTWLVRGYYRSKTWWRDGKVRGAFPCPDLTEKEIFTYDWTAPSGRKNRKQVFNSSYDNATVRITARQNWELMRDLPWHSGHYRWTGIDYLGEAKYVHGGWPFRAFMGGALDLALFPKDLFYFYQSQWTSKPMVHILPHWTHPKMAAGTEIPVWVYSNCDEVELFLNGKSLGKDAPGKKWDEMQCDWMVPWTPGTIEAVGYKDGKEVTRTSHTTAGAPAQLMLSVEGENCPIVTVTQQDKMGVMNPYGENRIHYHIDGDDDSARILSLEGGNPVNTENNFDKTSRTAFFGLTRAFMQTTNADKPLSVIIGAICGDKQVMTSDLISIDVKRLVIRGLTTPQTFEIRYSTDGSKPSLKYTGPFSIGPHSLVKAEVFSKGKLLFSMEEAFGPEEGIYWGDESTEEINYGGDQAEDARFKRARISTAGHSYEGSGYLDFGSHSGAFVEWYQENDGSPHAATLSIRYSGKRPKAAGRPMLLSVNGHKQKLFFPNTQGYGTDWQTLDLEIQLKAGANTIRITTIEPGGMFIDSISIK